MPDSNSDILKNPYSRRKFYAMCIAATVALVCLRYFVLPVIYRGQAGADVSPYSAFSSLLDNFIVALISSIIVTSLLLWLSPSVKEMAELAVVQPGRELKTVLSEDVKNCGEFWYRGHTAKWTRTVTIPALAKEAREERATKKICIIILDPDNESSCRLLADLDYSRNPAVTIPDRLKLIKRELIVSILTAYLWKEREPLLDIQVGLNNKFSLFRIDLYSRSAIITRSSPSESALRYSSTSDFYRAFKQELRISFQQAKQLPDIDAEGVTFDNLTVEAARNLLDKIGINAVAISDAELQRAVNEIKDPQPPY